MNSRQLQYAIILSEVCNFSQAAEKVGISQPAFSKHIISLENEIGIKLFDRSSTPLTLTPAGEFFIEKARRLVFEEDVLLKTIEKYKSGDRGKLTIGAVPFRSSYMMPGLIKKVKDKFPDLQVNLVEYGLSVLKEGLLNGEYDFAIMNLPVNEPEFETIPLEEDKLVLAVPEKLTVLLETKGKKTIDDFASAKKLPFVTVGKEQEMRKLFDSLCVKSGINPEIYATVTGVATAWEVAKNGDAATIIPKQFVEAKGECEGIALYEIKNTPYKRQPAVVIRKGQFVSEYAKFAINELKKR
ncbi:MAG: LysR family transcriptional regulator [Ruminococcaceae bacterium]|nr:LysR family transcriptional regulator [Oscillospiraceae bacterium]